jgi:hypothetical protein
MRERQRKAASNATWGVVLGLLYGFVIATVLFTTARDARDAFEDEEDVELEHVEHARDCPICEDVRDKLRVIHEPPPPPAEEARDVA